MVRITENKLVIEIPTVSPAEDLGNFRNAILGLLAGYDYSEGTKDIQVIVHYISKLLNEMQFSEKQIMAIVEVLKKTGNANAILNSD